MKIFISHAVADKALVDPFVDLLQVGLNIPQEHIFCTSLEGMTIPRGTNFIEFIRQKLAGAECVIALITPSYYESAFCLCELGAAWALGSNFFPVLVPPLDYDSLKAVLIGVQAGYVNEKKTLSELHDRLRDVGIASGSSGRWEAKRDAFIAQFTLIQPNLPGASVISFVEHSTLKRSYDVAMEDIAAANVKAKDLETIIEELKSCKDAEQVSEVVRNHSSEFETFESLCEELKRALGDVPRIVREAIYYDRKDNGWKAPRGFGNEHIWSDVEDAESHGFLKLTSEDLAIPDRSNPKIQRAIEKLNLLERFASRASSEFRQMFADENDYQFSLANKDLWREHLGL